MLKPDGTLVLDTPKVFLPLLKPARYKAAHGGRGGGKSYFFADMMIEDCLASEIRCVCIREVQKSIDDSIKLLIEDEIRALGVEHEFHVLDQEIRCLSTGSKIIFRGMQHYNSDSIKSLQGYDRAWCEEAQNLSARSIELLQPTIRKPGSEIWFSWNPENDTDPVDELFRGKDPIRDSIVVEVNWMDNPLFPEVLRAEMEECKRRKPDDYGHIWLGEYRRFAGGAIYGREMINAVEDSPSRITSVPYNPAFPVIVAWDLGYGDATALWFCQLVGREPRLIDYYENNMLPLSHYAQYIKSKDYNYEVQILPHDAGHKSLRTGTTLTQQLSDLGLGRVGKDLVTLQVDSVESGIQLARNLISQSWFDKEKCKSGIAALRKYHYEYDDKRQIFKDKPYHDWSSNGADSFRYLATYLATRKEKRVSVERTVMGDFYQTGQGWMG